MNPPIITEQKCEKCKFCKGISGNQGNQLACFRFPPQFALLGTPKGVVEACKWPYVKPDNWCGEFVPRILNPGLHN